MDDISPDMCNYERAAWKWSIKWCIDKKNSRRSLFWLLWWRPESTQASALEGAVWEQGCAGNVCAPSVAFSHTSFLPFGVLSFEFFHYQIFLVLLPFAIGTKYAISTEKKKNPEEIEYGILNTEYFHLKRECASKEWSMGNFDNYILTISWTIFFLYL